MGEPLGRAAGDPGGEGVGGALSPPGDSQGGPGGPGTTRSDSSRSDTSSSGASSSCCSSSGGPRRPCLHAALSDPGYESAHLPDDDRDDPEHSRRQQLCHSGGGMSLRERCEGRDGSPLHQGLTRSRSFGGLLSHRRSGSEAGSPQQTLGRAGWAGAGVLGQAVSSPRDVRRVLSLPPHVKVPKSPRPERAAQISASVAAGLRECVSVTRQDLDSLRQTQQDSQLQQVRTPPARCYVPFRSSVTSPNLSRHDSRSCSVFNCQYFAPLNSCPSPYARLSCNVTVVGSSLKGQLALAHTVAVLHVLCDLIQLSYPPAPRCLIKASTSPHPHSPRNDIVEMRN